MTAGTSGAPPMLLAGELAPLLLPSDISVEGEDQLADLADPVPPPALHAEEGHHTRDAGGEQRQRIKAPSHTPSGSRPACRQPAVLALSMVLSVVGGAS
jgi:hypothetical protein